MSTWHYQILKHDLDKDERLHYYVLHEVFNKPRDWTAEGIMPIGDTVEELIHDLEMMLADAKKYKVLSLEKLEKRYK